MRFGVPICYRCVTVVWVSGTIYLINNNNNNNNSVSDSTYQAYIVVGDQGSVARSLKLRHVDLGWVTWMGDHLWRLGAVKLGPFVGVD